MSSYPIISFAITFAFHLILCNTNSCDTTFHTRYPTVSSVITLTEGILSMTTKANESTTSTPDKNLIRYPLKNDYMFRAVFQSRPKALEGLCRSLLRLSSSDSLHIDLKNPIQLGAAIDNKEFVLDLALTINDSLYLNLEMQLYNDGYWPERSLSYTCRSFDNLNRGAHYKDVLPYCISVSLTLPCSRSILSS